MPQDPRAGDVAVIGLSCVFAGARNASEYWNNILAGRSFVADAPDEWALPYYAPNAQGVARIYTRRVGLLGDGAEFDPLQYGTPPHAVAASEPDHFLALKEATEALRDGGYVERAFDRQRTGVILGRGATPNRAIANGLLSGLALDQVVALLKKFFPHVKGELEARLRDALQCELMEFTAESGPGLVSNVAAGRIANRLDLMGPSYIIDAACASSLIAVDLAVTELRQRRSDMMLAGGVQASMPPQVYIMFCMLNALSRGDIRPFDAAADGTLLGEGGGFLLLKRREDAERDGDKVYALIRGIGTASDGKAVGLLAPRLEGECLAIRRAYEEHGIEPASVGLVEAHGTGIRLGDQTEIKALVEVFGPRTASLPGCAIGSVKSMIGHCIPAAGIASLIKVVLSLHHKVLPPTLCGRINPELPLDGSRFYVNTELRPWVHGQRDTPRRAGVNAFGFGGINAHAIVEEYTGPNRPADRIQWSHELFVVSGETRAGLSQELSRVREFVAEHPSVPLGDLACTLSARPSGNSRVAVVARDAADLIAKLDRVAVSIAQGTKERFKTRAGVFFAADAARSASDRTAFLFPGQGSQYPGMLADLYPLFPQVRRWLDRSDATFAGEWEYLPSQYLYPPPSGIADELRRQLERQLFVIDVSMEAVFSAGLALHELLVDLGLQPSAIVGHSTGEYTALAASGAFEHHDNIDEHIAVKRNLNRLYRSFEGDAEVPRGALLTVGGVEIARVREIMAAAGRLHLAMDNCPHQQIVFGPAPDIEAMAETLRKEGGMCAVLPYGYASHTSLFEKMQETLRKYYDLLPIGAPQVPLYSCSSSEPFPSDPDGVRRLALRQWWTPVRFAETIQRMYNDGVRNFIEIGPSNVLTQFVDDILRGKEHLAVASNERARSGLEQLLGVLGELFVRGQQLSLVELYRGRQLTAASDLAGLVARKPKPVGPRLNLLMPEITVRDEFLESVRPELFPSSESPVARAAVAVTGAGPLGTVMEQHQELMRDFLATQQRAFSRVLDSFSGEPPGAEGAGAPRANDGGEAP